MYIHHIYKRIKEITRLDHALDDLGYINHAVHTEPLIRREEDYSSLNPNIRRSIFTKLFFFATHCGIQYKAFSFNKFEHSDPYKLEAKISREISSFIRSHIAYFLSYDRIVLYYDNGQHELSHILNTVLATELSQYEVKRVMPSEYKLFQVADLFCTLKLLSLKTENGSLSRSELLLFHSKKDLKKDFLKRITQLELK